MAECMTSSEVHISWEDDRMGQGTAKTALITGIAGQDGCYLAELLIARGYRVVGTSHREGAETSIALAGTEVPIVHLSVTGSDAIKALLEAIRPDEIYNFASRSSSAQLFDDPIG